MTNQTLPPTSAEITYDADQASAKAFAEQYPDVDTALTELPNPRPVSQHFIEKPELPAAKSDKEFIDEFLAETGYPDDVKRGSIATEQVVQVDFSQSGQETPVPVEVQHDDVA